MPVHTFIAKSAADAVAQIRETLGPEAVVLNVRRLPAEGLARLWQKAGIEVLAHVPDLQDSTLPSETLTELRAELREIRQKVEAHGADFAEPARAAETEPRRREAARPAAMLADEDVPLPRPCRDLAEDATNGGWRVGALLENSGLLPLHAQSVVEELRVRHGDVPPPSLAREFKLAQDALFDRWDKTAAQDSGGGDCHVFVGPPGAGKTTALCKWLAQAVLIKGRPASVWRLDGQVANTAESLSVICEILGVPLERFQPAPAAADPGMLFIDLPGVNPADPVALATLAAQISQVPNAQVHLVLNGAYETSLLLAQVRAFAALPIADLIVTHLDEELRWGKLWNLVFGTNCRLRFLSAGQNIPGDFVEATPDRILERQFARK